MKKKTAAQTRPDQRPMLTFFTGLFLVCLGVFALLSFTTADIQLDPRIAARDCATGLVGAWLAYTILLTLGAAASYLFVFLLIAWGAHLIRGGAFWASWSRVVGGVMMLPGMSLAADIVWHSDSLQHSGLIAAMLSAPARHYLGSTGMLLVSGGAIFCGAVIAFGNLVIDMVLWAGQLTRQGLRRMRTAAGAVISTFILLSRPKLAAIWVRSTDRALVLLNNPAPEATAGRTRKRSATADKTQDIASDGNEAVEVEAAVVEDEEVPVFATEPEKAPYYEESDNIPVVELDPEPEPQPEPKPAKPGSRSRKQPQPQTIDRINVNPDAMNPDYQLPPLNILNPPEARITGGVNLQKRAKILEQTLAEFKIDGRVVQIERGPRVTLYEMTLAPGIRLTKVINLADNISMSLKASNVRIIAPIPGKDTIGIEIPNLEKELVTLREIMEAVNRQKRKQALPVCLAKDVSGKPIVADIAKMPHLLIAGATGSGKSVCINSIILSLMMCCKPDEVKMILVDPKVVELCRFKETPHLMSPVVTDMKRAVGVLEWACQKMDERYEQLSQVSVNNIAKFNALGEKGIAERLQGIYSDDEMELFPKSLPYIVIIIDELADLMLVAGKEVEVLITRLAAKSRAVGIHIILATQRPSVDVITGLIKANMPCRIAFQVASKVDSRTILDQNGAETLLGAGDMLYLPPGVSKLIRAQGVFVSDEEQTAVVDFCKAQQEPVYHADLEGLAAGVAAKTDISDFDDLFVDAGQAIIESGRGSVSLLQRKLGIGYGRASRIIDQLASIGVLGPFREGKAREILMTTEEFNAKFLGAQMTLPLQDGDDGEPLAGLRDDEMPPEQEDW